MLIASCGKPIKSVKLEKESALYQLAQELSQKVPMLDPEKNTAIVTTKICDITVGDVFATFQLMYGEQGVQQLKNIDAVQLTQIFKDNATALAEKKLLLHSAKKAKINVSDAKVDSILELQYAQIGGKEKFLNYLNNNNINFKALREDVRESLIINNYIDKVMKDSVITVSDSDIQNYYNEVDKTATVRHILMLTQGKSPEEKAVIYQKMQEVLVKAQNGENFETLVKKYSEDPGSKDNGGLYKDFGRGDMIESFENASFSLPIGSISDIVETPYGFHIIKVIERKKETRPFDTVRTEIEQEIKANRQNDLLTHLLDQIKLKNEFKVVIP
jgi:parvulin-like peptidyl-prolyl isomerase